MSSMYPQSPRRMDNPHSNSDYAPRSSTNVWKDTQAEELYGSYLDGPSEMQLRPTMTTRMTMGAAPAHPDITVGLLEDDDSSGHKKKSYTGRKRVWPGAMLLLLITLCSLSAIGWFGVKNYNKAQDQQAVSDIASGGIVGGKPRKRAKTIPLKICQMPNYVTDNGKLYATGNGKKVEVRFTGINWSGMENSEGVPHGLAKGQSSIDDIAKKLAAMEINAIRLPLNAKMIIDNSEPSLTKFVDPFTNPDLAAVSSYMDMIKKIIQGLAKQQIAVLLDLHKIDPEYTDTTSEELWYTKEYPMEKMVDMFKTLTKGLCDDLQYNIIGIDIKNEPVGGCWPADDKDDYCPKDQNWPRAVEKIGNEILKICPNWLIAVEGLFAKNIVAEFNGQNVTYSDWYGASLQNATKNPVKLATKNKIVYAPHFYSPSVYPASYFFAKHAISDTGKLTFEEYPDTDDGNALLKKAVYTVLDESFGKVLTATGTPIFYGEFGGIYGEAEKLKGKTSTRVIDLIIKYAADKNMTGGFSWAVNPDGRYDFNDKFVKPKEEGWHFGLYKDKYWDKYNEDYAKGLQQLKGNGIIPCFEKTIGGDTSGAGSASAPTSGAGSGATTPKATPKAAAGTPKPATVAPPAPPAPPGPPAGP
ncbi:TPA: hypothetical protein N0F65_003214 [Lagenidium giganteum]|uniref:Glycoside hydrolase family 5 domain-containing protein n=1 Tax=Lagenidium giganteum TaxID=4803 RepID=A0AAV2Z6P2_9STRA|nr:TPA: hypothetical protein N0F65_003214 [Lagenidium giganteum]